MTSRAWRLRPVCALVVLASSLLVGTAEASRGGQALYEVAVRPGCRPAGQPFEVRGRGFDPGPVTIYWGQDPRVAPVIGHAAADGGGSFAVTVTVPSGAASGTESVSAENDETAIGGFTPFTVGPPSVEVHPDSAAPGEAFDVRGVCFDADEEVTLRWDDDDRRAVGTVTASGGGLLSGQGAVPADAAAGAHVVTASGTSGSAPTAPIDVAAASTSATEPPPTTAVPSSTTVTPSSTPAAAEPGADVSPTSAAPPPTTSSTTGATTAPTSTTASDDAVGSAPVAADESAADVASSDSSGSDGTARLVVAVLAVLLLAAIAVAALGRWQASPAPALEGGTSPDGGGGADGAGPERPPEQESGPSVPPSTPPVPGSLPPPTPGSGSYVPLPPGFREAQFERDLEHLGSEDLTIWDDLPELEKQAPPDMNTPDGAYVYVDGLMREVPKAPSTPAEEASRMTTRALRTVRRWLRW